MATKNKNDRMAWFKMDAGFSNSQVGMYARLMVIYWASGNKLPTEIHQIERKVGAVSDDDKRDLNLILDEFFYENEEGKRCHGFLDLSLQDITSYSKQQSDRAKSGHSKKNDVIMKTSNLR
jgi:uncharacterized protein YdaU (DUF1376 family)